MTEHVLCHHCSPERLVPTPLQKASSKNKFFQSEITSQTKRMKLTLPSLSYGYMKKGHCIYNMWSKGGKVNLILMRWGGNLCQWHLNTNLVSNKHRLLPVVLLRPEDRRNQELSHHPEKVNRRHNKPVFNDWLNTELPFCLEWLVWLSPTIKIQPVSWWVHPLPAQLCTAAWWAWTPWLAGAAMSPELYSSCQYGSAPNPSLSLLISCLNCVSHCML